MKTNLATVNKAQTLDNVIYERIFEVPVKVDVLLQDVLEGPAGAVLGDQEGLTIIKTGSDKPDEVIVMKVLHLLQLY